MRGTGPRSRADSQESGAPDASRSGSDTPRWRERLKTLCHEIPSLRDRASRDNCRGEAWLLLNAAMRSYLRAHAAQLSWITPEDQEDIAAQKALDLLRGIDSGAWDVRDRVPAEIAGFLSTVARNGLVDRLRELGRRVEPAMEGRDEWDVRPGSLESHMSTMGSVEAPELRAERREYVDALRSCAEGLKPRSRLVWFLRVFCELSSREIAAHPEVSLKIAHVDVVLQRARRALRECMRRKGHSTQEIPAGAFVELWKTFRLQPKPVGTDDGAER